MDTLSALRAFLQSTGGSPQKVMHSFDGSFVASLDKLCNKQSVTGKIRRYIDRLKSL